MNSDTLVLVLLVDLVVIMAGAIVYPFTRNWWPGQRVMSQWQAHHYEYQQGADGRVRRRYNAWGETDFWGRWREPEQYRQPEFHGYAGAVDD